MKKKYDKTNKSTTNIYLLKITDFRFNENENSNNTWSKFREYRRKLVAANNAIKNAYADNMLFLILTKSLLLYYKAITDNLRLQKTMPFDKKLQVLYEVETDNKPEES